MPRFAKAVLKNIFLKKPKLNRKVCKGCMICVRVCPAQALSTASAQESLFLIIAGVYVAIAARKCAPRALSRYESGYSPLDKFNFYLQAN